MKNLLINYPKDKTYIIGVSGGPDSMCLLNILYELNYSLIICHVNYHKRKESNYEQEKIAEYAKERNIPFFVLDTSNMHSEGNFQSWARILRYQFFKKEYLFNKADGLFIAHNEDDFLETYLMQMKRKGIVSYYGINKETELMGMKVLRPLLDVPKKELQDYCIAKQVFYSIDSSNLEDDYTRNKIRHHVVSKLSEEERANLKKEIKQKNDLLKIHVDLASSFIREDNKTVDKFNSLDELTQNIFLHQYILKYLPFISSKLSQRRINEIKKIINSNKANSKMLLYPPFYFIKSYDKFYISDCIKKTDYAYIIIEPMFFSCKEFQIDLTKDTSPLNIFPYSYPLTIRNVRPGDVVKIGSLEKKVNRILLNEKIPYEKRKTYPVVLDCQGNIVYIPLFKSKKQKFIADKLSFVIK